MTCAEIQDRLDDYVDGSLSERDFQEVELHLHDCAECRKHERALRSLLAQAEALPAEMTPPRDLWPGIAERLGERSVLARLPSFARRPAGLGLAGRGRGGGPRGGLAAPAGPRPGPARPRRARRWR